MIYIIGGPARCGKTTLARKARGVLDTQVLMADGMMKALQDNLQEDWMPDLYYHIRSIVYGDDPQDLKVSNSRKRDSVVWTFLSSYFKETEFAEDNVLVEGNIWADMLKDSEYAHQAVFMVDTSEDHFERLMEIKTSDAHSNWMKGIDESYIEKYAQFNVARSRKHIQLCEELGYPYFDIARYGIEKAQQLALEQLVKGV